jgi:DNA-binding transcriptional LysR family regulator
MDLRRLEVFCKVVELGSFTKAADAVLLSQPTISEHIRTLEEILNERLIDRLGREIQPTPAGKILYKYARRILRLKEEAVQALAFYRGELAGDLNLGASTIPGTYILPSVIGRFKQRYPLTHISLKISGTADIAQAVIDGTCEIGLIGSRWRDGRLQFEQMFADELVLVVPPDHPWNETKRIPLQALYGEPFIDRQRGSGTRMVMTRILEEHGFEPSKLHVVAEMGTTEAVRQSVKAGIGVSILSRLAVCEDLRWGTLREVGLENVRFQRPFYLVQRRLRRLSPIAEAFLEDLKASAAREQVC